MLRLDPENNYFDGINLTKANTQAREVYFDFNYSDSNPEKFSAFYNNLSEAGLAPTDFLTKEPLPLDVAKEIATTLYQRNHGSSFNILNASDIDPQIVALEDLGPNIKYDKDELLSSGKAVQITDYWGETKTYCAVKSVPELIPTFDKEQYNARIGPIDNYNEFVSLFGKEKQDQLYVSPSDPDAYTKIYENLISISRDFLHSTAGKSSLDKDLANPGNVNIDRPMEAIIGGLTANLINQIAPNNTPLNTILQSDMLSVELDDDRGNGQRISSDGIQRNIRNVFASMANSFNQRADFLEKQQEVKQQQQLPAPEPKGFVQNIKLAYDKLANNINAVAEKFANKFDFAVQALSKTRLALTTKNLAIEQSKDKQQTVQPQKNTPEVKQQSKAKDMER